MTVGLPVGVRVLLGLLVLLAHVAFQPAAAHSLVLCTELDGRTVLERGEAGSCHHPPSVVDEAAAEVAAPDCFGCADRQVCAEPSQAVASKGTEAPRHVLAAGPPSQDVIHFVLNELMVAGPAVPADQQACVRYGFRDPFLASLRSTRLLT